MNERLVQASTAQGKIRQYKIKQLQNDKRSVKPKTLKNKKN